MNGSFSDANISDGFLGNEAKPGFSSVATDSQTLKLGEEKDDERPHKNVGSVAENDDGEDEAESGIDSSSKEPLNESIESLNDSLSGNNSGPVQSPSEKSRKSDRSTATGTSEEKRKSTKVYVCCMPECEETSQNDNLSFHGFPSDWRRKETWCKRVGLDPESIPNKAKICSNHFAKYSFRKHQPKQLNKNALPLKVVDKDSKTIFLDDEGGSESDDEDIEKESPKKNDSDSDYKPGDSDTETRKRRKRRSATSAAEKIRQTLERERQPLPRIVQPPPNVFKIASKPKFVPVANLAGQPSALGRSFAQGILRRNLYGDRIPIREDLAQVEFKSRSNASKVLRIKTPVYPRPPTVMRYNTNTGSVIPVSTLMNQYAAAQPVIPVIPRPSNSVVFSHFVPLKGKDCCVPKCESMMETGFRKKKLFSHLLYYSFPFDISLRRQWCVNLAIPVAIKWPFQNRFVCSLHFSPAAIQSNGRLRPGAVPVVRKGVSKSVWQPEPLPNSPNQYLGNYGTNSNSMATATSSADQVIMEILGQKNGEETTNNKREKLVQYRAADNGMDILPSGIEDMEVLDTSGENDDIEFIVDDHASNSKRTIGSNNKTLSRTAGKKRKFCSAARLKQIEEQGSEEMPRKRRKFKSAARATEQIVLRVLEDMLLQVAGPQIAEPPPDLQIQDSEKSTVAEKEESGKNWKEDSEEICTSEPPILSDEKEGKEEEEDKMLQETNNLENVSAGHEKESEAGENLPLDETKCSTVASDDNEAGFSARKTQEEEISVIAEESHSMSRDIDDMPVLSGIGVYESPDRTENTSVKDNSPSTSNNLENQDLSSKDERKAEGNSTEDRETVRQISDAQPSSVNSSPSVVSSKKIALPGIEMEIDDSTESTEEPVREALGTQASSATSSANVASDKGVVLPGIEMAVEGSSSDDDDGYENGVTSREGPRYGRIPEAPDLVRKTKPLNQYLCEICQLYSNADRSTLAYHARNHINEDLFSCVFCFSYGTKNKNSLLSHLRTKHKIERNSELGIEFMKSKEEIEQITKEMVVRCFPEAQPLFD